MDLSKLVARMSLLVFIGFGFFINFVPQEKIESFLLSIPYRCPLRLLTGWKCAFCGMTHSWIAVFRGDLHTAFHENWFGPVLWLIFFFILMVYSLGKKVKIRSKRILLISLFLLIFYATLRNII